MRLLGARRAQTKLIAADGGDVSCGIVVVAHAYNLVAVERVEPDDLTLEWTARRLRHAGPEEQRGHIVPANEVAAQLDPIVAHGAIQAALELRDAGDPAPGAGEAQHVRRSGDPPLDAVG